MVADPELLRRAVFGAPADDLGLAMAPGTAQLASFHGVASYVDRMLQSEISHGDETDRIALRAMRNGVALNHLRVVNDLHWLRGIFDAADVPWLVLKGPVLAQLAHGDPALRAYSDIDVLVPPVRLGAALAALEGNGATVIDRNWDLIRRSLKGEVHVELPSGSLLDLHWHLLNSARLRRSFSVDPRSLFERARIVEVGPVPVQTLSAEETIVYVALHAMLSGGHRLVWLKDVERLIVVDGAEPASVVRTAQLWGAHLALLTAIQRADLAAQTNLLSRFDFAASRAERAWLAVCRSVWRRMPLEAEDGSGSPARLLARSVRPTVRASIREMARRSGAFVRTKGDDVLPHQRTIMDPDDPRSILFASGGAAGRQAYLDAVAAWEPASRSGER